MASNFDDLPPEAREQLRPLLEAAAHADREAKAKKKRGRLYVYIVGAAILFAGAAGAVVAATIDPGPNPNPLWMRVGGGVLKGLASVFGAALAAEFVLNVPFRVVQLLNPPSVYFERDRQAVKMNEKADEMLQGFCAVVAAIAVFLMVLLQAW